MGRIQLKVFKILGQLLKSWNHSIFVMIPKNSSPQNVNHLRPIGLCIIGMGVFSRMLSLRKDIDSFRGIKMSRRSPSISHIFFATDVMLFFQANKEAAMNMKRLIARFSYVSGQMGSCEKSTRKFSPNVSDSLQ